ncbi:MAG TPA: uroporphyrinogen-III C-methyltransferase, partial [Stellaceae bacterium]|nr:uroporphyrinogen-III C-methyltransferase [Stellaceae bacterium]
IADKLIAAGRAADEPAAIVSRATTPDQRVVETTLARAAADATAARIAAPAMLVVGPAVTLRSRIDWFFPATK